MRDGAAPQGRRLLWQDVSGERTGGFRSRCGLGDAANWRALLSGEEAGANRVHAGCGEKDGSGSGNGKDKCPGKGVLQAESVLFLLQAGPVWRRSFLREAGVFRKRRKALPDGAGRAGKLFQGRCDKKRPWKAGSRALFSLRESRPSLFPKSSGISSFFTNSYRRYIFSESG